MLCSLISYNYKFWYEESVLLPFSFMLYLPGWTWQEPIWLWPVFISEFSASHIFYNPNWSLHLPGHLLDLSVRGWRVSGLEAYLIHFYWIQRLAWLLKLVISSATQPWLRVIEEVAGNEKRRMGQSMCQTGCFPFLFWDGPSYLMEEKSCPPQGFFSCYVIKKKKDGHLSSFIS